MPRFLPYSCQGSFSAGAHLRRSAAWRVGCSISSQILKCPFITEYTLNYSRLSNTIYDNVDSDFLEDLVSVQVRD